MIKKKIIEITPNKEIIIKARTWRNNREVLRIERTALLIS
jgi:hypothetical protein